jgi:hypothetical protein
MKLVGARAAVYWRFVVSLYQPIKISIFQILMIAKNYPRKSQQPTTKVVGLCGEA